VETLRQWTTDQLTAQRDLAAAMQAENHRFLAERSERFEQALRAERDQRQAALVAAERAAQLLESQAAAWRAAANEWRGAMQDRDAKLVNRETWETANRDLARQIEDLRDRLTRAEAGRRAVDEASTTRRAEGGQWLLAATVVIAIIAVVVSVVLARGR
jgi:hypothetical protein